MTMDMLPGANGMTQPRTVKAYAGKLVSETIVNGMFKVNRQWTVTYWNRAAESLLGVKASEIVGGNLWERFAAAIPLNFYAFYHKAFLQDVPIHFEEYWAEKETWFDVITYHSQDILTVSFKSCRHPVDPEHPVRQLKQLNELYRYVTEVTNDCLWEWDLIAKEIFWIDGGHKRVFGYPIENALVPQSFWESCVHPDERERILTRLSATLNEKAVNLWEDEYRFKKLDNNYAFVHDRGHIIYEGGRATRMVGATQDISARKQTERALEEERATHQQEITEAILTAQENERAQIGQELHDNVNQILGAVKLYIEMAKTDVVLRKVYLDKSSGYIHNIIDEIRRISKTLLPPTLHYLNLFEGINTLLEDLLPIIHPMQVKLERGEIDLTRLNEKMQLNLFRIVQEQINNILKHSQATHATIVFTQDEQAITLVISDDGKGYDASAKRTGVGIRNIRSRAELYQGTVTIVSKPGQGYRLTVVLPFTPAK